MATTPTAQGTAHRRRRTSSPSSSWRRTSRCSSRRSRRTTSCSEIPAQYLPSQLRVRRTSSTCGEAPLVPATCAAASSSPASPRSWRWSCSLPAAYYTARYRYRGRLAFLLLVLVTQMFAPTALVIGIYREFVTIGDIVPVAGVNTYLSLILVNAAFNLAFSTWIMSGLLLDHPGRAGGGSGHRRRHPPGRPPTGDPAAGAAGHRDGRRSSPSSRPGTSSSSPSRWPSRRTSTR